ncbi:MAG TPA: non-heme iron oxygenase ferredoxin subunit [Dehalococcoidia bacterium]
MTYERVAARSDVPAGRVRVFEVGERSIALANVDGAFFAIDNLCTHDGGPLGEGTLAGDQVECPRHGARFDVRTGAVRALPAVRPVRTYPVRLEGDEVSVDVG